MTPRPRAMDYRYRGADKLAGKVAMIPGGDSGIGRATAVFFAKEGADIAIVYLNEHADAEETKGLVAREGRRCLLIADVVAEPSFCREAVRRTVNELGHLDVLVNNAGEQHPRDSLEQISPEQLERTFRTNIFSYFYMSQAALPHLHDGSAIVNTTSVTAYRGNPRLIDYSATKGAIVSFTRSLALALVEKGIRVNGVAPGPVWTPLIPSTFTSERAEKFGESAPMKRPAQPEEIAPSYVFLACDDSSYMTGQVLQPNGGTIINS